MTSRSNRTPSVVIDENDIRLTQNESLNKLKQPIRVMWLALIDAMMQLISAWLIETGRSKNGAENALRKLAF